MRGFLELMSLSIWDFVKSKHAATECGGFVSEVMGTVATWERWEEPAPLSLISQKQEEVEGCTLPENEGFDDAGDLMAKFPTRIRTNWHGSMFNNQELQNKCSM